MTAWEPPFRFGYIEGEWADGAPSRDRNQLEVWKELTEGLGLAGVNAGEEMTASQTPERLLGVVERVQQSDKERYVLLRLQRPSLGIALIVTYGIGDACNASLILYLYGDDAAHRAAASSPRWQAWLREMFGPARR